MANEKYQVLTAPKTDGVSLEEAKTALAAQYPAYSVEVHEVDNEFVAKLARKTAAPKGGVPPFLDEDDDAGASADDAPDADAPDDDADAPKDDDAPKPPKPKKDKEDDGGDEGGDLGKALKALDTLKSVLPKLETQLKTLNGGDLPGGLGDGPLGPDGLPGPPGGPPGPGGPDGGPSQADLDAVGPTPGKPTPGNAKPMIPGMGAKGPVPPRPNVGVPTFSNYKRDKFVYRPMKNDDGTEVSLTEATQEITSHPRYAHYRVHEIKVDESGDQYVAHLKLNN